MPPTAPQSKKDEILGFLDERGEDDQLLTFEKSKLVERFTDELYDEKMVEQAIDELVSQGVLEEETTKLEIIYPKSKQASVKERFGRYIETRSTFSVFLWGIIIYLSLMNWYPLGGTSPLFEEMFGDINVLTVEAINRITVFGIIGAYVTGSVVVWAYEKLQKSIPTVRHHSTLIASVFGLALAISGAIVIYANSPFQPFSVVLIGTVLSISILGGIELAKLLESSDES